MAPNRFLDLLDPDHDEFQFAAGDDNQERARAALKASKSPGISVRHPRKGGAKP